MKRACLILSILLLSLGVLPALTPAGEEGFQSLFNGKDLTGWEGDLSHWSVEEGAITGKTTPKNLLKTNTFLVWKEGKPADFELRLSYRIVGGNSGIQYRSKVLDPKQFIVGGYQADIDSGTTYTGIVYEERGRGILAQRGQKVVIGPDGKKTTEKIGERDALQKNIKTEKWNDYVLIAQGNNLKHSINGVLMSEVIDQQKDKAASSGVIALQLHQGPPMTVQFKNIRLKVLK